MHRTAAARLTHLSALVTLLCLGIAAGAQTTRNVPSTTYPTIQSAIAASVNGDTVVVAPGTYPENIDFLGKAITVTESRSGGATISGSNPALPTVQFVSGEGTHSVLYGFTITGGGGTIAGASGTLGPNPAGGVYVANGGTPQINGNIITGNACFGVNSYNSAPFLLANDIKATSWTPASPCTSAAASGVWINGGGGSATGFVPAILYNNTIEQNVLSGQSNAGNDGGAAIAIWGAIGAIIQGNTLENNVTTGTGGAINIINTDSVFLVSNLITGNQAATGGAVSLAPPVSEVGAPNAVLTGNTIADNTITTPAAAGDATQLSIGGNSSRIVVANNIISGASSTVAAFLCTTPAAAPPISVEHNDILNTQGPAVSGTCASQAAQGNPFTNISVAPGFVNESAGNYQLQPGSPTIDTGNTSALADLFINAIPLGPDLAGGNHRVLDATGLGYPVIDMGAYESAGPDDAIINTLVLTSSAYATNAGSTVNLTASLFTSATSAPSGTVNFSEDGTAITPNGSASLTNGNNSTTATITTPPLTPGLHSFTSTFDQPGATPATAVHMYVLVGPYATTLSLTCPASPAAPGSPVSFGISLTSSPNGPPPNATVTLYDNASTTPFDTVQLSANGTYTYTTSSLTPGAHNISAQYAGTLDYQPAASNICRLTISGPAQIPTAATLIAAPGTTVAVGTPVTFTAQVTNTASTTGPIPAGTVNLLDGSTLLATQTLDATGVAHFAPISTLTVGPHTITANYIPAAGTPSFAQSSASLIETITAANSTTLLTATPNPAFALAPVTLTAIVTAPNTTAIPTGTVNFLNGAAVIGSATLVNGQATTTAQFSANPATHSLTAVYSGNSSLNTSTSNTVLERINPLPSTTTINATPTTASAFTAIHLTSHTSSAATTPVNTPACNGQCTPLVTFVANGNAIGTSPVDANGNAALTITPPAGTYSITATFSGSGIFTSSTSTPPATVIVTALGTSLALVGNPSTVVVRQPVLLTATLAATGAPASALSGPITFSDGGTLLGTGPLSNGVATLTYAPSTPGTHLITAVFAGTASLGPSSATFTLNVTPRDFTITTASPSLTIRTEHHASIQVQVATEGGLVDTIVLSCANLPQWATCTYYPGALSINQTATPADSTTSASTLTIDTDFVLGYAQLHPTEKPATRGLRTVAPIAFAVLIPGLALFGLRRRTRLPRLLLAALLSVAVLSAAGCSGLYPPHTAPGTYTINVTGLAQNNNLTRSTPLTLIVTP